MTATPPNDQRPGAGRARLRVMQITDLHANILPYDYFADRPAQDIGLARTAGLAAQLRAEAANALLLDNGDFLQGNPLADYFGQVRGLRPGEVHPVIAAMNAAGVEVATLGNHDFDYGLDFLHAALAGAGFPVVSANVLTARGATPADDRMLVAPWVILDRHLIDEAGHSLPIRVGVIGFAPPQITRWSHPHLDGRISARDIMQAARAQVPALRAAGADLVIALCHSGLAEPDHVEGQENAGIPLAGVEGIDVVLAGHQHLTLPGPAYRGVPGVDADAGTIRGKPAVMAGFWGGHLGVIDLALGHDRGRWRILDHDSRLYPIAARQPDGTVAPLVRDMPAVTRAAAPAHAETLDYVRRPVGRCTGALHSYFALAGADPCVALLAQAQRAHVRQALKGTEHDGLPILSAVSPFKAGGRGGPEYYSDVPAGDLAIRHVADLYPYPNTVQAVRLTGAQVRAWLERAASLFNRIVPGQPDQMLMERDAPAYQFDVLDGLRYRIDLGQPARFDALGGPGNPQGARIVDLTWQGQPVADDRPFVIATNSYRAGGGGQYPGTGPDSVIHAGTEASRDILLRHIADQGTVHPGAVSPWQFAPMPGTSVLFDTGPGALHHLPGVTGLAIEPAGKAPGGFLRFRIHL